MIKISEKMATAGAHALRDTMGDINQAQRAKTIFTEMMKVCDEMTLTDYKNWLDKGAID